ncbi:MAG: hypothetical protein MZW92_20905 [Comamonadaceae bacterium]|nr:hypothetical protein [Comamonadaceae bacterium]
MRAAVAAAGAGAEPAAAAAARRPTPGAQLAGQQRSRSRVTDLGLRAATGARRARLRARRRRASRRAARRPRRCAGVPGAWPRGEDDADRLFFERALVMEGDTEYGPGAEEHARRDRAAVPVLSRGGRNCRQKWPPATGGAALLPTARAAWPRTSPAR